jgi:hypothetical protein
MHEGACQNQALGLLGAKPLFDDAEFNIYGPHGFRSDQALSLDELKKRFNALGPVLAHALNRTTVEQLALKAPFSPTGNPNETVGTLLASIAFHEAYHLGQTGLSRRLLGKPGALLAPGEEGPLKDYFWRTFFGTSASRVLSNLIDGRDKA